MFHQWDFRGFFLRHKHPIDKIWKKVSAFYNFLFFNAWNLLSFVNQFCFCFLSINSLCRSPLPADPNFTHSRKFFLAIHAFTQIFPEIHAKLIFREIGKIFGKIGEILQNRKKRGNSRIHAKNRADLRIHAIKKCFSRSRKFFQFTHSRNFYSIFTHSRNEKSPFTHSQKKFKCGFRFN